MSKFNIEVHGNSDDAEVYYTMTFRASSKESEEEYKLAVQKAIATTKQFVDQLQRRQIS